MSNCVVLTGSGDTSGLSRNGSDQGLDVLEKDLALFMRARLPDVLSLLAVERCAQELLLALLERPVVHVEPLLNLLSLASRSSALCDVAGLSAEVSLKVASQKSPVVARVVVGLQWDFFCSETVLPQDDANPVFRWSWEHKVSQRCDVCVVSYLRPARGLVSEAFAEDHAPILCERPFLVGDYSWISGMARTLFCAVQGLDFYQDGRFEGDVLPAWQGRSLWFTPVPDSLIALPRMTALLAVTSTFVSPHHGFEREMAAWCAKVSDMEQCGMPALWLDDFRQMLDGKGNTFCPLLMYEDGGRLWLSVRFQLEMPLFANMHARPFLAPAPLVMIFSFDVATGSEACVRFLHGDGDFVGEEVVLPILLELRVFGQDVTAVEFETGALYGAACAARTYQHVLSAMMQAFASAFNADLAEIFLAEARQALQGLYASPPFEFGAKVLPLPLKESA